MIYFILRRIVDFTFKLIYKGIYVNYEETIPDDGPVIFVANHPNGFLEPCILACEFKKPLYFLARGDLFSVPWLRWILIQTHQLPIFRFKDGFAALRGNDHSIAQSLELLNLDRHLLIFAEGSTIQGRQLRKFQKGTAKLALNFLQKYPGRKLYIQPIGVNFTSPSRFGSEVYVHVGSALDIAQWNSQSANTEVEKIRELTNLIYSRAVQLVWHVDDKQDEHLADHLIEIASQDYVIDEIKNWSKFNLLAKMIQRVNTSQLLNKTNLNNLALSYHDLLDKWKLQSFRESSSTIDKIGHGFFLAFAALPLSLGYLFNWPPIALSTWITNAKVKDIEFVASVKIAIMIPLFLMYYLILLILGSCLLGWRLVVIGIILICSLGIFAAKVRFPFMRSIECFRLAAVPQNVQTRLQEMRSSILNMAELLYP